MAAIPTEGEENPEPLKFKTWVLKVSIHCEGCKRKVKRILHSVEGVYTIDVDTKQHKVTVTGNVDSNTLIRKLEKSGKHAELWPDSQKNKNPEEQVQQQEGNHQLPTTVENERVTVEEAQRESSNGAENSNPGKGNNGNCNSMRVEGNIPTAGENPNQGTENKPPPESDAGGEKTGTGGSGSGSKRKKKKGHKGNNSGNNNNGNVNGNGNGGGGGEQPPSNSGPSQHPHPSPSPSPSPHPHPSPSPVNMSPPRHRVYEYPPAYYGPPPVYAVSYNTAYPSSRYTASYYSAPPHSSYMYVHQGGSEVEPAQPSDWNSTSLQPSDTFELFSDENPNACSVM